MYIAEKQLDAYFRFDVSEVFTEPESGKVIDINYIENAFEGASYESIWFTLWYTLQSRDYEPRLFPVPTMKFRQMWILKNICSALRYGFPMI